jgi:hypothetical protein
MSDIHVSEDSSDKASIGSPLIPDPPADTPTSSPIKNTRSSMKEHSLDTPTSSPITDSRSAKPDADVAMQGVEAVKGAQNDLSKVSVNSDKVLYCVDTSSDKNISKKVTERVYASDPWKLETMKKFDNPRNKKSSTA